MQNRYAGDIGDFGKLGLLRQLRRHGLSIGVNWYLTPDEDHNGDGRFTGYLHDPHFADCDRPLWEGLGQIVRSGSRTVAALQDPGVLDASYYDEVLDLAAVKKAERPAARAAWHRAALQKLGGCDVIFADPDNGLMVPSAQGGTKSGKYVLPEELWDHCRTGASVVYYQHKARRPDRFYTDQHQSLLAAHGSCGCEGLGVKFTATSLRYYFFFVQPRHKRQIEAAVAEMLSGPWRRYFEPLTLN